MMSRLNIAEKRLPQDGKCKLKVRGQKLELRVATVPTVQERVQYCVFLPPAPRCRWKN